jgi:hypothetical protein
MMIGRIGKTSTGKYFYNRQHRKDKKFLTFNFLRASKWPSVTVFPSDIANNKYRGNVEKLGEWTTASHIKRGTHSQKPPTQAAAAKA